MVNCKRQQSPPAFFGGAPLFVFKYRPAFALLLACFLFGWSPGPSRQSVNAQESKSKVQWNFLRAFRGETSATGLLRQAVALDLDSEGSVYVVDRALNRLLKFSSDGELIREVGGFGREADQFDDPRDVDAHNTLNVFVADFNNNRVVRLDRNLNFISDVRGDQIADLPFEQVLSVSISTQYDIFLLENVNKQIIKLNRQLAPVAVFGGIQETFGQLLEPVQINLQENQRLFVSDAGQSAVLVFDYLGNYLESVQLPGLSAPAGLYWGQDQHLYVVDSADDELWILDKTLRPLYHLMVPPPAHSLLDVAVRFDKTTGKRTLYLLSPGACWVAEVKNF
ncbi:MAG: hypothetical protein D6715_02760 [Calditrichaeota bacterium]|nr:MAG: hypothetical protein D6715_02760 [Calditrichota bacterium]